MDAQNFMANHKTGDCLFQKIVPIHSGDVEIFQWNSERFDLQVAIEENSEDNNG